jgi:hypothetical protein
MKTLAGYAGYLQTKTLVAYLVNLSKVRKTSCYSLRCNEGTLLEDYGTKTKKTLGDRAFVTSAPKIWNELPMYIRNLHNFSIFKKLVKTYYFVYIIFFIF